MPSAAAPLLHYFAAKTALAQYSRGVAQEFAPSNIRVNVLTPGVVVTPGGDDLRNVFTNALGVPADKLFKAPLGRMGETLDIAEAAGFLLSDRASWITGQNFHVDGGMN
jgi:NAD(P)-dependent dehydrogenase (short-subunit alcohol dehydrogenase family)